MNELLPRERDVHACTRCIFDNLVDPDIYFDENGVCNHCRYYDERMAALHVANKEQRLQRLVDDIKASGKGKKYDCIIGVSGGADSSYVAYVVKELGLRPLAVHCDNGWNTELAVNNIASLLRSLNIDLYTHVINWEEFKDLQLAYLKASVIDVEAPSDHAIVATMYNAAVKFGVRYILSGENFVTEGYLPESWVYLKSDLVNLKAIHKRFGQRKLKTFPTMGFFKRWYNKRMRGIKYIPLLDYVPYVKEDAKKLLTEKFGWRDYGGKHYESIITRFYQSYILPLKFGVDKRYSHLSTLVCSGQMTRDEALAEARKPPYDHDKIAEDKAYVVKKFGLTEEQFDALINQPVRSHTDYPSSQERFERLRPLIEIYKSLAGRRTRFPVLRRRCVAMLLDNVFEYDYRVFREATALAAHYDVTLFALRGDHLPRNEIVSGVNVQRILGNEIFRIWRRSRLRWYARTVARKGFETVHVHDSLMLDIGRMIKTMQPDCKLIYDSHELFHSWPLNLMTGAPLSIRIKSNIVRRFHVSLEKRNARVADRFITVNQSIADNLKSYFQLSGRPVVLRNVPLLQAVIPGKHLLRNKFNIGPSRRILVFIAMNVYPQTLNLEQVMDELGNQPDASLVFVCKHNAYRDMFEQRARDKGFTNMHFHDVVKPEHMNDYLCDCDAGLVPTWNKKDLSYWYALDNKLFNYLMAEIPILTTAQPEYKHIVDQYNVGMAVNPEEPNAYLNGFRWIVEHATELKPNVLRAKQELNWEKESEKLLALYKEILG